MTNGEHHDPNPTGRQPSVKWFALGCGGCLGLTVLVVVLLGIFVSRTTRFALEPEAVETEGQTLFTYTLPGEGKGILSMELFGLQITQVATSDSPPSAILTVGKVPGYLEPGVNQDSFADTLQERITVEGTYQLQEQRTEERSLCGQSVNLLIQEGQYQDGQTRSDAASYFTVVDYNDQTRFAWILTQGETPLQTADQVFASLKCQ